MPGMIHDDAIDAALNYIKTNVENLYICSQEPLSFAEVATYKLGTKAAPATGTIGNGDVSGRKLPVTAITDGTVNNTGTATWKVLTDDSLSKILAKQALNASQAVTAGNTFTLTTWDIEIPDPTV